MLGFIVAFWAAPTMTAGPPALRDRHHRLHPVSRCSWKSATSSRRWGDKYREYRRQVPMLLPLPHRHTTETIRQS